MKKIGKCLVGKRLVGKCLNLMVDYYKMLQPKHSVLENVRSEKRTRKQSAYHHWQ